MSLTGKDMCEWIVKSGILRRPDGTAPTAEEIWNYSPTGELSAVFEWYDMAVIVLGPAPDPGAAADLKLRVD